MFVVDVFIASVAVPSIRTSLHITLAQPEAVLAARQSGYVILLITGDRLGNLLGRRCVFLLGLVASTATLIGCKLADSTTALTAWRLA